MTTISPTRVSMYDFLYQNTQPMASLLADTAKLSLPQTRLALSSSLQAIVSALLSYQQRYQGQAVSKKLFTRSAVKELRQYHSMNFATINATLYHRHDVAEAIFCDSTRVIKASEHIAAQIDTSVAQVQILLSSLCVIVLRELAVLADYSQLDNDELDKWFALQPQFLSAERFAIVRPINTPLSLADNNHNSVNPTTHANDDNNSERSTNQISADQENYIAIEAEKIDTETKRLLSEPPPFDPYWYELTTFKSVDNVLGQDMQQATANYLKVIGRSTENIQQGRHNDLLMFAQMPAIALPHQRWLLQLAKVSDIYLHRNRLRINSEPTTAPTPPSVNLQLISGSSDHTSAIPISDTPVKNNKPVPLWKNPIILIIIMVIGSLSALASLKYQKQKSDGILPATEAVMEQENSKEPQ
ncbi:hypothetical protein [Psychrobacter sp. CAL346-MNA-CIBAN-0220]|uniref:hypothetical protein n=1 Tax=Psychrobacter sp. CAL346-MNA-CIBAN-0220 TaxID=3140457 RepID=UPI00332701CB